VQAQRHTATSPGTTGFPFPSFESLIFRLFGGFILGHAIDLRLDVASVILARNL
jgi:hypothetical protein